MTDAGYRCQLGAAIGSGCIWTFGDSGFVLPAATAAAVGIVVENGSGQACQAYFVWSDLLTKITKPEGRRWPVSPATASPSHQAQP